MPRRPSASAVVSPPMPPPTIRMGSRIAANGNSALVITGANSRMSSRPSAARAGAHLAAHATWRVGSRTGLRPVRDDIILALMAVCGDEKNCTERSACHADPLDLPFELDAGMLAHARTHGLAQRLDVGGSRAAEVDQEIAVHLGDLRTADREPAAAGGVDELPGFAPGRVLEGRAAGAALDRLGGLARFWDLVHFGGEFFPLP